MIESRMTLSEARTRIRNLIEPVNKKPGTLARIIGWLTADQPKTAPRKRVYLPTQVQGALSWEPPQRRKGKRK
jgi:hypothetical protein